MSELSNHSGSGGGIVCVCFVKDVLQDLRSLHLLTFIEPVGKHAEGDTECDADNEAPILQRQAGEESCKTSATVGSIVSTTGKK